MGRVTYPLLATILKKLLKSRGVTYADLATTLKLSESGVKKILNADDGSLNRIEEIAHALGLGLSDVVNAVEADAPIESVHFTLKQEEFFVENLDYFHFFWKLVYEERSATEIKAELGLTSREVFRYLRKLDQFGLITLLPDERVNIPSRGLVKWTGSGPLLTHIKLNWAKALIDTTVAAHEKAKDHHYSLRYYQLTESSFRELFAAIEDLNREFANRSLREKVMHARSDLREVSMVAAIAPRGYVATLT